MALHPKGRDYTSLQYHGRLVQTFLIQQTCLTGASLLAHTAVDGCWPEGSYRAILHCVVNAFISYLDETHKRWDLELRSWLTGECKKVAIHVHTTIPFIQQGSPIKQGNSDGQWVFQTERYQGGDEGEPQSWLQPLRNNSEQVSTSSSYDILPCALVDQ
jgi:hypothetical protein